MKRRLINCTMRLRIMSLSVGLMLFTAGMMVFISAPKPPKPIIVGMIALLASPQKYNGKIIQTIGYLNIGSMHENDNLWLHEEDGKLSLFKNSFALDLSDDQRKKFIHLNHTYVLIVGTLHSEGPEGTNMNSGIIMRISRLDGWQPYRPSLPEPTK